MNKKEKVDIENSKGRIYNILNQILVEYDKSFRKEFCKNEFEDKEALKEVISFLSDLKYIEVKKNFLIIKPLGIRYLKSLYADYNRYETNLKFSAFLGLLSFAVAGFSLIVSILTLNEDRIVIGIILEVIYFIVIIHYLKKIKI